MGVLYTLKNDSGHALDEEPAARLTGRHANKGFKLTGLKDWRSAEVKSLALNAMEQVE